MTDALKTTITWTEWKQQWEQATDIPARMGLLHSGFDAEVAPANLPRLGPDSQKKHSPDYSERVRFYLKVAEMPKQKGLLGPEPDKRLSNKALSVLALRFFKKEGIGEIFYQPPAVLDTLLDFLKTEVKEEATEEREDGVIKTLCFVNKPDRYGLAEPVREIIWKFVASLGKTLWTGVYYPPDHHKSIRDYDEETIKLFKEKRLVGIEILAASRTGCLHELLPPRFNRRYWQKDWEKFATSLSTLQRISLLEGRTVEEAFFYGSEAAEVLLLAQVGAREYQRKQKLREAKIRADSAARELRQLTGQE